MLAHRAKVLVADVDRKRRETGGLVGQEVVGRILQNLRDNVRAGPADPDHVNRERHRLLFANPMNPTLQRVNLPTRQAILHRRSQRSSPASFALLSPCLSSFSCGSAPETASSHSATDLRAAEPPSCSCLRGPPLGPSTRNPRGFHALHAGGFFAFAHLDTADNRCRHVPEGRSA